jgi:hypothetical protein
MTMKLPAKSHISKLEVTFEIFLGGKKMGVRTS